MRRAFGFAVITALALAVFPVSASHAASTSTTTVLEAPNQFGVNSNMPVRVQVTSDNGAAAPTGTVSIYNSFGAFVQTLTLTPTDNGGYSWVEFTWAASVLGRNGLRAVYNSNSTDFASSASSYAGIQILTETPLTVLRMPGRFVVDAPATLTLIITPANGGGSATFNVNNVQYYASTPNRTGSIAFTWTPTESIPYTFVSNYSNAAGNASESLKQSVFANPS